MPRNYLCKGEAFTHNSALLKMPNVNASPLRDSRFKLFSKNQFT
jgi:hypothetical protein